MPPGGGRQTRAAFRMHGQRHCTLRPGWHLRRCWQLPLSGSWYHVLKSIVFRIDVNDQHLQQQPRLRGQERGLWCSLGVRQHDGMQDGKLCQGPGLRFRLLRSGRVSNNQEGR